MNFGFLFWFRFQHLIRFALDSYVRVLKLQKTASREPCRISKGRHTSVSYFLNFCKNRTPFSAESTHVFWDGKSGTAVANAWRFVDISNSMHLHSIIRKLGIFKFGCK